MEKKTQHRYKPENWLAYNKGLLNRDSLTLCLMNLKSNVGINQKGQVIEEAQ
jgi:hypothetical protein